MTVTINWAHILALVITIGGILGLVLFLALAVGLGYYFLRGKKTPPAPARTPARPLVFHETTSAPPAIDPHELAAAVAAHLQEQSPPALTPLPNHPAVAAVTDLVQKGADATSKLQQIATLAGTIQTTAAQ